MTRLAGAAPKRGMQLRGRYRLLITGDTDKLGVGYEHKVIGYLFQRLLTREVAVMDLEHIGITVRLLGDNDEIITVPSEP